MPAYVYKVSRRTPARTMAIVPPTPPVIAAVEPVAPAESPAEVIPATAAVEVATPKKTRKATGPKKARKKKSDG